MKRIIPNLGLYGTPAERELPALAHIEQIRERGDHLGWQIKPHRHTQLYQILCVYDGELEIWVDDHAHRLVGSWVVTIPLGSVHSFVLKPGNDGVVLSVTHQLLTDDALANTPTAVAGLINEPQFIDFTGAEGRLGQLQRHFDSLSYEIDSTGAAAPGAVALLFQLILIALGQQHTADGLRAKRQLDERRLEKFRFLVDRHFRHHWTLDQYASELNVSTSTLKRLCMETFHTHPKAIVRNRLINEAKRRLIYTQQPLDELAYTLGFKDPAYFSRAFKKLIGVSPSHYRERNGFTHLDE